MSRLKILIIVGTLLVGSLATTVLAFEYWPRKTTRVIEYSMITNPTATLTYTSEDGYECSIPVDFKNYSQPPGNGDKFTAYWKRRTWK